MAKKKEMIIGITAVLFVILIGWLVYLKSYHNTAVLDDKVTANAKDRQDEQEEKQEEQGEKENSEINDEIEVEITEAERAKKRN